MPNCTGVVIESPNGEQIAVGVSNLILSTVLLVVYVPVVTFLWRDEDLMSRPVFKILVWDSVCDLIQLIGVGFGAGIYSLLNNVCNRTLNLTVGAIVTIAWMTGCFLDLSVSLNRLLAVTNVGLMENLFGGRKCYFWVVAGFAYGVAINAIFLARGGGTIYDLNIYTWYSADADDSIGVNAEIELIQDYITQPLMLVCCVLTAYQLIKKRKTTTQGHLHLKERYAIYQVFIICFLLLALTAAYLILPKFSDSRWVFFAGNTFWVIVSGSFPFIVLKFNLTVRERVFSALLGKSVVKTNKVFVQSGSASARKNRANTDDIDV